MLLISKCGQEIVSRQYLNFKQTTEIVNDLVTDFQISNFLETVIVVKCKE